LIFHQWFTFFECNLAFLSFQASESSDRIDHQEEPVSQHRYRRRRFAGLNEEFKTDCFHKWPP